MKNRLVLLSLGFIIAGCTASNGLAPYENKGSKFYGRNTEAEETDVADDEEENQSDFVFQGRKGDSNSQAALADDLGLIDENEEPSQSYRNGRSVKINDDTQIKTSKLTQPEHIDEYEEKYDSAEVKVPSFNQPNKTTSAKSTDYLDLSPVQQKVAVNNVEQKGYSEHISSKLKNITPKNKPQFAQNIEPEKEAQEAEKETKQIKVAEIKPPKNKPAALNEVAPAAGNNLASEQEKEPIKEVTKETIKEKPAFINIPTKPATIAKVEDHKKLEIASVKEEIQADAKKTDITSIPKMESSQPAGSAKFIKPVDGKIIQEFGAGSDGIKIQAAEGTPVKAAAGGEVVYSGNQLQGYGNMIVIRHSNGYLTAYSHLEDLSLKKGTKVSQGDIIGKVGKSGNVSSPQLHFGVRKGRSAVNPRDYL